MSDAINHPVHYKNHPSGVECITITEHMGFNLGNAVKYIWRADFKGKALEDLKKAQFYLAREVANRQKAVVNRKRKVARAVVKKVQQYKKPAIVKSPKPTKKMTITVVPPKGLKGATKRKVEKMAKEVNAQLNATQTSMI